MEDNEDDKTTIGLTFLKVKGAGHLVPHDQPENSLDMVIKHIQQAFD